MGSEMCIRDSLYIPPTSVSTEFWFTLPPSVDLSAYRTASAQDIIDSRATNGILLARQEAATADGKAVAAQLDADDAQDRLDVVEANGWVTEARLDSGVGAKLNGSLNARYIDVEPGVFVNQRAAAIGYHLVVHGYPTNADPEVDNIQIAFQGQLVHSESWSFATGSRVIDFELSTIELANVTNNLRGRDTVQVQVAFRDGISTISNSAIREVPVEAPATAPAAPQQILQAAVDGGDSAGRTSIALPANYTTFRTLYITVWETNNDRILEAKFHTSILAAQTADRTLSLGGLFHNSQADRSSSAVWSPRTRTITLANNDRIIFALLE